MIQVVRNINGTLVHWHWWLWVWPHAEEVQVALFFNLPNALVPGGLSMPALVKQNIFSAVHSPSYQPK